jgi:hypothetical protein
VCLRHTGSQCSRGDRSDLPCGLFADIHCLSRLWQTGLLPAWAQL